MKKILGNLWIRIGLGIAVLGWLPLLLFGVWVWLGLSRDPHPNPIGLGLLAFLSFWPAAVCIGIGVVQLLIGAVRDNRG